MCEDGCEETCVVRGCDKLSQLADSHKLGRTSCGQLARSEEGKYKYNNKIQWQIQNTAYSWSAAIRGSGLRAVVLFPLVEISLHFPPLCLSGGWQPSSHTIRLHTHTHTASHLLSILCFAPIGYFPSWNPSLSFSSWLFPLFIFLCCPLCVI